MHPLHPPPTPSHTQTPSVWASLLSHLVVLLWHVQRERHPGRPVKRLQDGKHAGGLHPFPPRWSGLHQPTSNVTDESPTGTTQPDPSGRVGRLHARSRCPAAREAPEANIRFISAAASAGGLQAWLGQLTLTLMRKVDTTGVCCSACHRDCTHSAASFASPCSPDLSCKSSPMHQGPSRAVHERQWWPLRHLHACAPRAASPPLRISGAL